MDTETLVSLYNEADGLFWMLKAFSGRIEDHGLTETMTSLGVGDARKALFKTLDDLERRIQFSKEK